MLGIFDSEDEITSIEYLGEQETIDINVSGNRLFYANGLLTHNSATEEIEFDHSHIAGGISKISTADNVFGIFTSRSMREKGQYQIQLMKTRSSNGVGQKIELDYNVETLRITDPDVETNKPVTTPTPNEILAKHRIEPYTDISQLAETEAPVKHIVADVQGSKLRNMLRNLK